MIHRIILILLLFVTPALGMNIHSAMMMVCKEQATGCNPGVGYNTPETTDATVLSGRMLCSRYQANCSGTWGYAYAYHTDAGNDNAKVCVYDSGATTPTDASTLVADSSCQIVSSSTDGGWDESAGKIGGSAISGNYYWLCIVADTTAWYNGIEVNGAKTVYENESSNYGSPPANLDGTWGTFTTTADLALYVVIE
jgi:hypothetical protein